MLARLKTTISGLKKASRRGRDADSPRKIPFVGWIDILVRVKKKIAFDFIGLIAAGVAFFFLLAVFPALAAMISLYGLIADPAMIADQFNRLAAFMPPEALRIIETQAATMIEASGAALSVSLILSLLFMIFSATRGVKALIKGFNIAYNEKERRNLLKLNLIAYALTVLMIFYFLGSLALVAVMPAIFGFFAVPEDIAAILMWLRWPILFVLASIGLQVLYRFGPCRTRARWRWLSFGSFVATLLWIIGSSLFSLFVSNFGNFNEMYGSISAVIILLLWFWLSALFILLGAEINAMIEHQTERDTTVGRERPMGKRGAYVADTLGDQF